MLNITVLPMILLVSSLANVVTFHLGVDELLKIQHPPYFDTLMSILIFIPLSKAPMHCISTLQTDLVITGGQS